jgi:hypothetical protein
MNTVTLEVGNAGSLKKRPEKPRVFPLDELEGFYVDKGICVHITFEDAHRVAIDLFDDAGAAYDPNRGELVRSVILDLSTGEMYEE